MKRLFLWMALITSVTVNAQTYYGSVKTITEAQYDVSGNRSNWSNMIDISSGTNLWKDGSAEIEILSTYNVDDNTPISDDMQGFSNIDTQSRLFRLAMLGIYQQIGSVKLFAGLRNSGIDYFTSIHSALLTGSSHGIPPTISNNYDIATYPTAALSLHCEWQITPQLLFKSTFYNGSSGETLKEQIHWDPNIKNITALYFQADKDKGFYSIGIMSGKNIYNSYSESIFAVVEQPIIKTDHPVLCALFEKSIDLYKIKSDDVSKYDMPICQDYYAGGLTYHLDKNDEKQLAIAITHAKYHTYETNINETDMEMTYSHQIGYFHIQPAFHAIKTNTKWNCIGMLRVSFDIDF